MHCLVYCYWASFFHSRKICTTKKFQIKKFERRDDLRLHLYIGFSKLQKKIKQQPKNHCFLVTFRVLSLPEKTFTNIFLFWVKTKFSPSPRLCSDIKKCSRVHCQTVIYSEGIGPTDLVIIHQFLEIFHVPGSMKLQFQEWQNKYFYWQGAL